MRAAGDVSAAGAGCLPSTKTLKKCEATITKAFGTLIANVIACHTRQADAAFSTQRGKANQFDEEACEETDPKTSALAKFDAVLAKVKQKNLCPTDVLSNATDLAAEVTADRANPSSLDSLNGRVYCDTTSNELIDPNGDDAGAIPGSADSLACSDGVARNLVNLVAGLIKCRTKAAAAAVKGGFFDESICRGDPAKGVRAKYDKAAQQLTGKVTCPQCLDLAGQGTLADDLTAQVDQWLALIFVCPTTTSTTVPGSSTTSTTIAVTTTTSSSTTVTTTPTTSTTSTTFIPPDPKTVAPPVNPTQFTDLSTSTAFLYAGGNPIQVGVAPGTIVPMRAAVLRGKVAQPDGTPLSGVRISILGHPELGLTYTRTDGMFDLAVNGGGVLTVDYFRQDFIPVQRQVLARWKDYTWLPDVMLIPYDPQSTLIDLSSSADIQVARGTPVTDARGTRQATLLFRNGTRATMRLPDGSSQPLTTFHVRATEQSVGNVGPQSASAEEPAGVAYTFGADFSVDEAVAAGAKSVDFSPSVVLYLENFIGFPVGGPVPVGSYDRDKGVWMPVDNGRIVKVLNIDASGLAQLDIDGSGQPASADALATLGITEPELAEVGKLYQAGQTFERVPLPHFSYWDT